MLRFARWKVASILGMTLAALLVIVPSFWTKETLDSVVKAMPKWLPIEQVVLGLDLQGGAHLLYQVDSADVTRTQVNNLRDDIRRVMREESIPLSGGIGSPKDNPRVVQVLIPDAANRAKALTKLRALAQPAANPTTSLLGVAGAASADISVDPNGLIKMTVTDAAVNDKIRKSVDQTIEVLNRRVNALGTTEPNIQRVGDDRVLVEVPGLQDTQRLKDIVGTTAKLEFRLVSQPGANPADVETLTEFDKDGQPIAN